MSPLMKKLRQWNVAWHRDLGYFFTGLIILYCISGLALNHVNDWNPDFIVQRKQIPLGRAFERQNISTDTIKMMSKAAGETQFKVYDFPTQDQVKIYYEHATLHVWLHTGIAQYERLVKRHVFYEANVLHRNSLKGWKWVSDIFACFLIFICISGLLIARGKYGFKQRGVWLVLAGLVLPVIGLFVYYQIA